MRCWCRELRSGTAALCATQRRTSRHAGCRAHRDARRHLIRAFQAATVVQCANPARAGDCDRESLTVVNLAMLAASSAVTLAVRPAMRKILIRSQSRNDTPFPLALRVLPETSSGKGLASCPGRAWQAVARQTAPRVCRAPTKLGHWVRLGFPPGKLTVCWPVVAGNVGMAPGGVLVSARAMWLGGRATAAKPCHEPAREPRCYTGAGRL